MVERKRLAGDDAIDYLGIGRGLLAQLRQAMQLNQLKVLSREITLNNGVRITVSSVFGQDGIQIDAPNAGPGVQKKLAALADELQELPPSGFLRDSVRVTGELKLVVSEYIPPPPPPPPPPPAPPPVIYVPPPPTPPPPVYFPDPVPDPTPVPEPAPQTIMQASLVERTNVTGQVTITVITRTPGSTTTTPGTATVPSVFIAGGTQGGDAFVWDNVNGYQRLNKSDTFASAKRLATVFNLSSDGQIALGSVEIYDGNVNPATINPFSGGGGQAFGWIATACKWTSRTGAVQVAGYVSGKGASEARNIAPDGTVYGVWGGTGMKWDGSNGHAMTVFGTGPSRGSLVSPDGAASVSGSNYIVGGVSKVWRGLGGNSAPNDAVAFCCVHVNVPAPPPVVVTNPGTTTTTTLFFDV